MVGVVNDPDFLGESGTVVGRRLDRVVAGVLVVATAGLAAAKAYSGWERWLAVIAALGLVILIERRRHPLAVVAIVGATAISESAITNLHAAPTDVRVTPSLVLAMMVATYSLGAYERSRWRSLLGIVVSVASIRAAQALAAPSGYSAGSSLAFFGAVAGVGPFALGRIVRSRRRVARRIEETAELLEATAEQHASEEVTAERARLGHSLESSVLAGLDDLAQHSDVASLDDVATAESIARRTLTDVRQILVGLRADPEPPGPPRQAAELRAMIQIALESQSEPARPEPTGRPPVWRHLPPQAWRNAAWFSVSMIYTGGLVATTVAHPRSTEVLDVAVAVALGVGTASLRRWPVHAALACGAATVSYGAAARPVDPLSGVLPTAMLALVPFALGAWSRAGRTRLAALAVSLATVAVVVWADPGAHLHPGSVAPTPALIIGFFAAGALLQDRAQAISELALRLVRVDQLRAAKAATAVRAERNQVSRELHDAMAHSLTAILLQATAARRVWTTNPDLAHQHAASLRDTMATTLGELRHLVIALSMGSGVTINLQQVAELADQAQAAGLSVELHMNGDLPPTAPEIELAAYRITQEALTNAARHAPGSHVTVQLAEYQGCLSVKIVNGPASLRTWPAFTGPGHGIEGMHARARACGGQLVAQPTPQGGFSVTARLPLSAAP